MRREVRRDLREQLVLVELPQPRQVARRPGSSSAISTVTGGALPPTLDVVAAAQLLGIGRTVGYRLIRTGQWPTHVVRVGRKIKIPTVPLLEFLGIARTDVGVVRIRSTASGEAHEARAQSRAVIRGGDQ